MSLETPTEPKEKSVMTEGIVYIAFGEEYDRLAAHTVAFSMPFIKCGVTVLTNLKKRCQKWDSVKGVNFIYLDIPTDENRRAKIECYKYTPYDKTLFIDVDSVIRCKGIEKIFSRLDHVDVCLQRHSAWKVGKPYYRLYRDTFKYFGLKLPLKIFLGGFWAFKKSDESEAFFKQWLKNWNETGCGRDMPSLCSAVAQTKIKYYEVTKNEDKFFSFGLDNNCICIHRISRHDLGVFNIPMHKQNKPFDIDKTDQWDFVMFEEKNVSSTN